MKNADTRCAPPLVQVQWIQALTIYNNRNRPCRQRIFLWRALLRFSADAALSQAED
jgi:hypothetical protein